MRSQKNENMEFEIIVLIPRAKMAQLFKKRGEKQFTR